MKSDVQKVHKSTDYMNSIKMDEVKESDLAGLKHFISMEKWDWATRYKICR